MCPESLPNSFLVHNLPFPKFREHLPLLSHPTKNRQTNSDENSTTPKLADVKLNGEESYRCQ